ncbi:MAG: serine/threonine-protein kinase [Acidimicrobiales bacterium]|nr:serine/threonine-protein kinase [Acidimicrobiales bacterium]
MSEEQGSSDGVRVDGFSDLRRIGHGGFSAVYDGVQDGMARRVAIKVLNASIDDETQRRAFERECALMGRLSSHPNIVTVHAPAFTEDRRPCIVMELYAGNYRSRVTPGNGLEIAEVIDVGITVAEALAHVHRGDIVHRDVKPHNIFVSEHGPVLADFGISSVRTEQTVTGAGGFSVDYSAPEVLEEGDGGIAADIYALGASLFHLAAGQPPFASEGEHRLQRTIQRIMTEPPPRLERSDAPSALDRLLREAMDKDAVRRPISAESFATRLRDITVRPGASPSAGTSGLFAPPVTTPVERPPAGPRFADSPSDEPTPTSTGTQPQQTVTVARAEDRVEEPPDLEPAPEDRLATAPQRAVVVGVAAVVAALLIGLVVWALARGDDGSDPAPTTTVNLPVDDSFFDAVPPPTGVDAVASAGVVTVSWVAGAEGLDYVIQDSADNVLVTVASSPALVEGLGAGTHCLTVKAVNDLGQQSEQEAAPCVTIE